MEDQDRIPGKSSAAKREQGLWNTWHWRHHSQHRCVILWFGFRFNKRLESMKTETGWKKTWADDCLGIAKKVRLGPY